MSRVALHAPAYAMNDEFSRILIPPSFLRMSIGWLFERWNCRRTMMKIIPGQHHQRVEKMKHGFGMKPPRAVS
ncbi:hypothetical protein K1719_002607 [Acacia pycnantha]|nr:hypothetical protein K1719_021543 [Acacia pycnantha]KAI9126186.1 hypothetical protein K1719_002607 [Acacia pycnantha]